MRDTSTTTGNDAREVARLFSTEPMPSMRRDGWRALCPAHDDSEYSLEIWEGETGGVAVKCRAGCSEDAIWKTRHISLPGREIDGNFSREMSSAEPVGHGTQNGNSAQKHVPEKSSGHPKGVYTAAELMTMQFAKVKWAVPELIPEGVTILAGKPKLGKSWLAMQVCLEIAAGDVVLGHHVVERGDSLYLGLEDSRRRLRERLAKLLGDRRAPENLHLCDKWPRFNDGGAKELIRWILNHPSARLIVIDTLQKIRKPQSGNGYIYKEDYEALSQVKKVADDHGVAIVLVHHVRKAFAEDPFETVSGSTGLTGAADTVMVLKRRRAGRDAVLHVTGRDVQEADLSLHFDGQSCNWEMQGNAEDHRMSEERKAVLRVLREAPEPVGPQQIAQALDERPGNIRRLLAKMTHDGTIEKEGRGRYVAP